MAILATLPTPFGPQQVYVRLNCFEQLANHGAPAHARFYCYLPSAAEAEDITQEKHIPGMDILVEFEADAPENPWALAYAALKASEGFEEAVDA